MSRWIHDICVGDRYKKSPEKVGNEPHLPFILSSTVEREDEISFQTSYEWKVFNFSLAISCRLALAQQAKTQLWSLAA